MKTICLDYDGSFTEFPELFDMIIKESSRLKYKVILATMRYPHEEDLFLKEINNRISVYYTSRKAKLPYLESMGIEPDLWIDDRPDFILNNASK